MQNGCTVNSPRTVLAGIVRPIFSIAIGFVGPSTLNCGGGGGGSGLARRPLCGRTQHDDRENERRYASEPTHSSLPKTEPMQSSRVESESQARLE